jgi:hypothetical protein
LCLKAATVVTVAIFVAALAAGIIPAVVIPIVTLCVPALLDRVTVRPEKRPPSRVYTVSSIVALAYSAFLLTSALLR